MSRNPRAGFALLPVVLLIGVIAAIAFLITHDGVMSTELLRSAADADEADYVAEAGLRHALWQLDDSACGGDLTLASTGFGAHSYSGSVVAGGSTTAYSLSADRDAWIRNDIPTSNNGSNADQHIRFEAGNVEHALYHFDVSSLPAGAQINSATAWFYVKASGPHPEGPLSVHAVTADWTEGAVTWDSFDASFDSGVLASIEPQPAGDVWVRINLTAQVQAWVNGEPNHGILLESIAEGTHAHYISREGASGQRPRLDVVVGTSPASPASVQATGSLANGVTRILSRPVTAAYQPPGIHTFSPGPAESDDAEIWDQSPNNNYGNEAETWVSSASNDTTRSLLRFNVGAIPTGAKILGAALFLHRQSGSGAEQPVSAHRIRNPWSEDTVSWNSREAGVFWDTAGGDFDNVAVATTPVGPANQRYEWNITPLVQGWVGGNYPNYGVALTAAIEGMPGERFYTSDQADTALRPGLTVTYACECGSVCMAPNGSGNVMMVVGDPTVVDPSDALKKSLLEAWGYTVNLHNDNAGQTSYDSKFTSNDVVYVSATAVPASVGSKLTNAPIGVVNEQGDLNDELGISGGAAHPVGASVNIVDNSHFITWPFASGPLAVYTGAMEGLSVAGSEASGLQTLANWGSAGALVVLDTGAAVVGGGSAAGRRVMLPLGRSTTSNFDWNRLGNSGRLIVQRALQWASGNTGPPLPGATLWLSTLMDVTGSGAPGLADWTAGEVLELDEPNLAFEPGTTDGTFASVLNLDAFAGDGNADLDAIHRVDTAVRVGSANGVDLLPGDVLFSTVADETLSSTTPSFPFFSSDVILFRPDTVGDYSSGSLILLLDGTQMIGDTVAVSLVEKDTVVGDGGLSRGRFIVGVSGRRDVIEFTATDVGLNTTVGVFNEFVDGPSLSFGSEIRGIELAEDPVSIGGHAIPSGAILLTLNNDDAGGVGDNLVPADSADVFYLTVTQTGANPVADATLLFEGADVNLDTSEEHLQALSLSGATTAPAAAQNVLFVMGNVANPTTEEEAHELLLTNWGYTVERIDDDDDQPTFDAALVNNDVAFVTNGVTASRVSTKLSNATIGVVSSEANLSDELGMGSSIGWESGTLVTILDVTHYITEPFPTGALTIFTGSESLAYVTGTLAPDLVQLASSSSGNGIVTLDAGSQALGGRTSPGRRVLLPWGGGGFHPDSFNSDGELLLKRALEWGIGEGDGGDGGGGGGGGGGGSPPATGYVEAHQPWSASVDGSWESFELGSLGVPAGAVAEVAVTNRNTGRERWGGVRAAGSNLERRFRLHEAEGGGVDAVVMHVQADASSRIEHYTETKAEVTFTLLGYWTGAEYQESFVRFTAGGSGSWRKHGLSQYGVPPTHVAEIAITNDNTSSEIVGGVQPVGPDLGRTFTLHEAESGGVVAASLMVTAADDDTGTVQVFAGADSNVDFYLLGYWSTPPGTYTDAFAELKGPSSSGSWQDRELASLGVPAYAVANVVMSNHSAGAEVQLGVREKPGADRPRMLDLVEAESGGATVAPLHVNTDDASTFLWYDENVAQPHQFTLIGWWVIFTTK